MLMAKPGPIELDQPVMQQLSKRPSTSPCLQPACHSGAKGQAAAPVTPHTSRQSNPGEYGNKGAAAEARTGHDKMEVGRRVRFKTAQPAAAWSASAQDKSDQKAPGEAGSEAGQSVSGQAGLAVSPRQPQTWQPKGSSHKVAAFPVTGAPPMSPKANDTLSCHMTDPVSQSARLISYTEAMQLIAEGTPSAITGQAFDHLLHHAEPAVMEIVLQNLAIAASMQSDQKAQLVNMLSCQGLTQPSKQHFKVMTSHHAPQRPSPTSASPTQSNTLHMQHLWTNVCMFLCMSLLHQQQLCIHGLPKEACGCLAKAPWDFLAPLQSVQVRFTTDVGVTPEVMTDGNSKALL